MEGKYGIVKGKKSPTTGDTNKSVHNKKTQKKRKKHKKSNLLFPNTKENRTAPRQKFSTSPEAYMSDSSVNIDAASGVMELVLPTVPWRKSPRLRPHARVAQSIAGYLHRCSGHSQITFKGSGPIRLKLRVTNDPNVSNISLRQESGCIIKDQAFSSRRPPGGHVRNQRDETCAHSESRDVLPTIPQRNSINLTYNESLRWEYALEDPVEEEERIKTYKMNRRKRYIDARNKLLPDLISSSESTSSVASTPNPAAESQASSALPELCDTSLTGSPTASARLDDIVLDP